MFNIYIYMCLIYIYMFNIYMFNIYIYIQRQKGMQRNSQGLNTNESKHAVIEGRHPR